MADMPLNIMCQENRFTKTLTLPGSISHDGFPNSWRACIAPSLARSRNSLFYKSEVFQPSASHREYSSLHEWTQKQGDLVFLSGSKSFAFRYLLIFKVRNHSYEEHHDVCLNMYKFNLTNLS